MKITSNLFSSLLISSFLFVLVSCGSDEKSSKSTHFKHTEEQRQDDQGIYRAVLKAVNSEVAGETIGTVEVKIEGDDFRVESHVTNAPSGVKHLQNIMSGTSCPSEKDTIIDFKEAIQTTGKILIPLDSNLSEQLSGIDYGPIANGAGTYIYRRSTSLSSLLSDLRAPDPDLLDFIEKLPLGEELNLSGKVVVIQGAKSDSSLPIACGKLVRVSNEETGPAPVETINE